MQAFIYFFALRTINNSRSQLTLVDETPKQILAEESRTVPPPLLEFALAVDDSVSSAARNCPDGPHVYTLPFADLGLSVIQSPVTMEMST